MKKFITDTLFISVGGLLSKAKGIIFLPLIIGAVGLSNYGAFVQIYANCKILIPFCTLGLGMGFQRFASKIEKDNKAELSMHFFSILIPSLFFGFFGVLVLLFISPYINNWFLEGKYLDSLQVSSLMVLSNTCYTNINKFLLGGKKFKLYSILEFSYAFLPYLGFVLGSVIYVDIYYGILFYTLLDFLIALLFFIYITKDLKFVMPSKKIFKQYFQFSYPLAISNIEGGLLNKADRYFISYFLGVESLGLYNIVHRLTDLLSFVSVPIRKQMMSYLPKVWDGGFKVESINIIKSSLIIFSLISIGILGYLTFYFNEILFFLINKKIELPNIEFLIIFLGLASFLSGTKVFFYILIRLKNETKYELLYQMAGMIINLILNFILVPIYGLLGSAIATFVSYSAIIYWINYKHPINLDLKFFKHFASFFAVASIFYLINNLIPNSDLLLFVTSTLLATCLYMLGVLITNKKLLIKIKADVFAYKKLMKGGIKKIEVS